MSGGERAASWSLEFHRPNDRLWPSALKACWDDFAARDRQASAFQTRPVVEAWYRHKAHALGMEAIVCVAEQQDSALRVLLPLAMLPQRASTLWTRRVILAGEPHFDYQDPLVLREDPSDLRTTGFWRALEDGLAHEIGAHQLFANRLVREVRPPSALENEHLRAPYARLDGSESLDHYLARRSGNLRTDVRRRIRRLNERGRVCTSFFSPDAIDAAITEFRRMVSAYEDLWQRQPSGGLFRAPGTLGWYDELFRTCLPTGLLQFAVTTVDGEAVAWCVGFLHRGVFHWYKPTYRKDWGALSPGKVLLAHVVDHACRRGWREIDFGPGMEDYKTRWTSDARPVFESSWRRLAPRQVVLDFVRRMRKGISAAQSAAQS